MSDFQFVCELSEIPDGEGRSFVVGKTVVGLFRTRQEIHAIADACPHMAASLSVGYFEDYIVTCPLHAWQFDVRDGSWCDNPRVQTKTYETRIVEGKVEIRIPDDQQPAGDSAASES